jgi:hypothetical protein
MRKPPTQGRSTQAEDREIVVVCPVCKEKVRLKEKDASRTMTATCSKGHKVQLVSAL